MKYVAANCSRKIWYFWIEEWEAELLKDTIQQVTIKFKNNNKQIVVSIGYARCSSVERLELWENLSCMDEHESIPWIMKGGRDFNVILNEKEKLGGGGVRF